LPERAAVTALKERLRLNGSLLGLRPHMEVAAETEEGYLLRLSRARKLSVLDAEAMV
jgi:hypothetical protein